MLTEEMPGQFTLLNHPRRHWKYVSPRGGAAGAGLGTGGFSVRFLEAPRH